MYRNCDFALFCFWGSSSSISRAKMEPMDIVGKTKEDALLPKVDADVDARPLHDNEAVLHKVHMPWLESVFD
ncbi:hypothetical protein LOK49_LG09G01401 [Camellia lanceoleosa]|uniref:Uncharacterized protein n=1 Tax=Camellia lanceoleosa TaxID=1840588 RepID=A0ACC0GI65_9ERIC|nr:hypothetical protein LOK49_LG09G01401 [Camellia lanceoleosa]